MTEQEKLTLIELLQEVFAVDSSNTNEEIFDRIWAAYSEDTGIGLGDDEMTEQELADYKEFCRRWFTGMYTAGRLLKGDNK